MKQRGIILLAFVFLITNLNAQSKSGLKLLKTFHIASAGGWDYLAVSPLHDWLYVSHGSQVNILNKNTGDSVGVIENTTGVHGIAFDIANGKGYTSNGRLNTVTVFDLNTNKVLTLIATGQNPDAIIYEPFSKRIITCNGSGKNLSIINPALNVVTDSVDVGGKPEEALSDGTGKLFVNIEDKNEIVVINMKTFKIIDRWSILPGESPTGLKYDPETKRLFAGCDKLLLVINAENGKVVDQLPIGEGCDGVAFDRLTKNIYTSNGDGSMTVIHEDNADKFTVIENIITKKGARTITLDEATHKLYLPTAEFAALEPNQKRAKMIPGTFQVLEFGKK